MFLFFKMRSVDGLDIQAQKAYLEKYLDTFCNFKKIGVNLDDYIEHTIQVDENTNEMYLVSKYSVSDNADFAALEFKIKIHNLHKQFLIFAVI